MESRAAGWVGTWNAEPGGFQGVLWRAGQVPGVPLARGACLSPAVASVELSILQPLQPVNNVHINWLLTAQEGRGNAEAETQLEG